MNAAPKSCIGLENECYQTELTLNEETEVLPGVWAAAGSDLQVTDNIRAGDWIDDWQLEVGRLSRPYFDKDLKAWIPAGSSIEMYPTGEVTSIRNVTSPVYIPALNVTTGRNAAIEIHYEEKAGRKFQNMISVLGFQNITDLTPAISAARDADVYWVRGGMTTPWRLYSVDSIARPLVTSDRVRLKKGDEVYVLRDGRPASEDPESPMHLATRRAWGF